MGSIYAVGDIHGQSDMLDHALALIAADGGPDGEAEGVEQLQEYQLR